MSTENAIRILKARLKFVADVNIDAILAYELAIQLLEKQSKFSIEDFADYLIENASEAFQYQDRDWLEEILERYFRKGDQYESLQLLQQSR